MIPATPVIEPFGDHEYLVHIEEDEEIVTIRMRADPTLVAEIGGPDADESRVVAATVGYLTARQRADELPQALDLQDVAAAYDGYVDQLRGELRGQH